MGWRVLKFEERDAFANMAVDEAVCEFVKAGESLPTIRFYGWKPSAVSIGYFQEIANEVNLENCVQEKVDVVRRRTGGGAVYHDNGGEITYSVIAPVEMFPKNIIESYREICSWIVSGLGRIGLQGEFKPINDIIVNGKKISGNAQSRRDGVLLQHGTVLHDVDVRKMFSLLRVSEEKISDKLIASVEERVTSVKRESKGSVAREKLHDALLAGFTEGKEWETGKLSGSEEKRAAELASERYRKDEWNFSR